ncbi:Dual specificity protein phosphatase 22-A [Trichoplax sp. H2]|nr:Dual specificity protein phosphatase 22-A [Trichoplax sp. H2]|eukprot:RDD47684.1 Dual specificity protein phosphatase 22-A [Trichoplax sp. H2]
MGFGFSKIQINLGYNKVTLFIIDEQSKRRLKFNGITHILSIYELAKPTHKEYKYKCIRIPDHEHQDISQFFKECIEFIHECRIHNGSVLVHCVCGVSRSVTVVAAYLMAISNISWRQSLNAVKASRTQANPNSGFRRQLMKFEERQLAELRKELKEKYPEYNPSYDDGYLEELLRKMSSSSPILM